MDVDATRRFVEHSWKDSIIPALEDYITIPNQSPAYDPQWQQGGHMDAAVELVCRWVRAQQIKGLALDVVRLAGRTPVILIEIPGEAPATVLMYGHLDKQPPMEGWDPGLGPWDPVIKDGKLYGRGSADDGYAAFAAVTAVKALQVQSLPHARCVVLIEASEESGSTDLPYYIEALADRVGTPSLVVCLDSGCGNYEQLWMTQSLRGLITGNLTVSMLTEGVHSGAASGVVPSTFRVVRLVLSRLEDERTGGIIPRELYADIPAERMHQAEIAADVLGAAVYASYPFRPGAEPVTHEVRELLLNRTWRPQLEVTGAAGLPPLEQAGNVLRPTTTVKLSLRLPPSADPDAAVRCLTRLIESDPPYGAHVRFECEQAASGWNAPSLEPWLRESVDGASRAFFGKGACYMGEGGTIPFMAMLGEKFPGAQFLITGVLGPHSNAHGPNECLDLGTGMRLTACIARVLHDHFATTCR
jgi:acetylornithine deacetylase/succinyl-diaminopimelate desuccinylase-like protein